MSVLRDKTTATVQFRGALEQIAIVLLTEASKHWPTLVTEFETPLAPMTGATLAQPVVFVPILRAGLGLLEGMLRVVPKAEIGHIGLYRDEVTLFPVWATPAIATSVPFKIVGRFYETPSSFSRRRLTQTPYNC